MKKQNKGTEIFGLHKIPDHILLKHQLVEIGKLKAYIDELEDRIKQLKRNNHK